MDNTTLGIGTVIGKITDEGEEWVMWIAFDRDGYAVTRELTEDEIAHYRSICADQSTAEYPRFEF